MKQSRNFLFLIELLIAVLVFVWGCAICIQVFVVSDNMNSDNMAVNKALLQLHSTHSVLNEHAFSEAGDVLGAGSIDENSFTVMYDEEFNITETAAHYYMFVEREGSSYYVSFKDGDSRVFLEQELYIYDGKEGENE